MRKKHLLFTILIAILFMAGCKKNDTTVTPAPPAHAEIILSSTSVTLGPGHIRDSVTISNNGEENLSWSVLSKPEWTMLSHLASVLTDDGWDRLEISFDPSSLAYGDYAGSIQIESNGGDAEIAVSLNYLAADLNVNQGALYFDRNHLFKDLIFANEGTDSLGYEITQYPDWIVIHGDLTGTLEEPDTLMVEARPWGMDYGDYQGVISTVSNGGDIDVTVSLVFRREVEVFPGQEAAGVNIGDLYQEVLDLYGDHDFATFDANEGVHCIGYSWIGLKIYFRSYDLVLYPYDPCYEITLEEPYDGLIDHENTESVEIGLGSTRNEIVAVFGDPDSQSSREEIYDIGIAFRYDSSDVLSKMRVWEP